MSDELKESYKSTKSRSEYTVSGTKERAYITVCGEAATNSKVLKAIGQVRKDRYDFATANWYARQLSNTY